MSRSFLLLFFGALGLAPLSHAQTTLFTCDEAAVSPVLRGEGITERVGDIVFDCQNGTPSATITGNFTIFLNVNITNRINSSNQVSGVSFTVDNGSGPQPVNVPGLVASSNTLEYNGVSFTLSSTGSVVLAIKGIRAAASQLGLAPNSTIDAQIASSSNLIAFNQTRFPVGVPIRSLYAGNSTSLICAQSGSPLPANTASFASFLASHAAFASTRLTEGFPGAFAQKSAVSSLNADTGTRFLITYSGFPAGAQLFVPTVIAGSDAIVPTSAGDLGLLASGGKYQPSAKGSLLLSLVQNTDENGKGGQVLYTPFPPVGPEVTFDSMSQLTLNNGTAIAVYEVVDGNPNAQESAQFPTYLGLAPSDNPSTVTTETVSYAPVSGVIVATQNDPIPRFLNLPPPADCSIIGDCNAPYYPKLYVNTTPLNFTAQSGGDFQVGYVQVNNKGGGHMPWAATVSYTNGSGWVQLFTSSGIDNATIRVDVVPTNLAAGTYQALLTVDAGPQAGSMSVPITFVVTPPPPPPPPPTVTSIVNAATFVVGPAVPGSILTLIGSQLGGKNITVGFNGMNAEVLFDSNAQINAIVPAGLGNVTSAQLTLSIDGNESVPQSVPVAEFNPGIFKNGILNQNGTVNGSAHTARPGSILQIFATGVSDTVTVGVSVNGTLVTSLEYAGVAPGIAGVQQVNVALPAGLTNTTAQVELCGAVGGGKSLSVCSPAVPVVIGP